ncbi:nicotinate (nicotinamide) nucleotide adenylyltransferase [Sulfurimonas sp.]|uniref:nicotinate (nicotinamide) nucleotide adenylyltransferase n=1 Tax=Sulfurimonas sp. TaxID=2022749 RepID=UPI00261B655D|nr:nicotinate (nicotinamide) nucleotide adenylyltransferase [Sulfurimonas sp.]
METVALYGGSFDPPHIGHEAVVKALSELSFIDKTIVMPTYLNPFKRAFFAPPELRLKWLKNIFSSYKNVQISSFEVDLQREVATVETIKYLKKKYSRIYLVIGADNLKSLHKWQDYDELKESVHFIIAKRDAVTVSDDFIKLEIDENISSSSLRKNMDIKKLPKAVAKQIAQYYKEHNAKQNTKNN